MVKGTIFFNRKDRSACVFIDLAGNMEWNAAQFHTALRDMFRVLHLGFDRGLNREIGHPVGSGSVNNNGKRYSFIAF